MKGWQAITGAALLFSSGALFSSGVARADCNNLRFQQFDGFHDFSQEPLPTVEFKVRANDECRFFVTMDYGGAASYQTRALRQLLLFFELPVSLCLDPACSRHWKRIPEATADADVLAGYVPPGGGEVTLKYYPRVGSNEYPPYGTYEGIFVSRLYEGSLDNVRAIRGLETLRLRALVTRKIDVSLVSTGFPFDSAATSKTLDFGLLAPEKELGFDVLLKYNAGYRLRLASANRGVMKHVSADATIPYTLYLNNAPVSLGSGGGVELASGSGASPAAGLRFPGRVRIGAYGAGARAGAYEDRITLTVSTNE